MEAIILAGGKGTRLQGVVRDVPKPMADINGVPFLQYLLDYLIGQGVNKVILSTGYKHQVIEDFFGKSYKSLVIDYSVEENPLGTGGAIKQALSFAKTEEVWVLNGDTFFQIDFNKMLLEHKQNKAVISIAVKEMTNFDRYGNVKIRNGIVSSFEEKRFIETGFINGGIYLINKLLLKSFPEEDKFSFEQGFMEKSVSKLNIHAFQSDGYFIDIGIPEDYEKAQNELLDTGKPEN